ncbi:MAG: polyprenyl synthetase family protein, partial [Gammaproteobacteria bacterium]|nr:polyprenyl synthetase family protein [Gammaproteobacteria bacterium]
KGNEATAILVGDALQSLAFQLIADAGIPAAEVRLNMLKTLAQAAGSRGMVGGQAMDLAAAGQTLNAMQLEDVHRNKTGALILASLQLGALCGTRQDRASKEALTRYGNCIGLAFQVQDDILDVEGDAASLGKQSGADAQHEKATYPALMGLEPARAFSRALSEEAITALEDFDARADLLRALAQYIVNRDR